VNQRKTMRTKLRLDPRRFVTRERDIVCGEKTICIVQFVEAASQSNVRALSFGKNGMGA
jgi:hypothetical protein